MSSDQPPPLCSICNAAAGYRCSICIKSAYCSAKCLLADAPVHNTLCRSYVRFKHSSPVVRLGIVFPEDGTKIRFVWIPVKSTPASQQEPAHESVDLRHLVGPAVFYIPVDKNVLRERYLQDTLQVIHREGFMIDGSTRNKSIYDATDGGGYTDWKGPVVVMKKKGIAKKGGVGGSHHDLQYTDITVADLRDAVDFLIIHGRPTDKEPNSEYAETNLCILS